MIYIKVLDNNEVLLGGTVATKEMTAGGWVKYNGTIPQGSKFKMVNGKLKADLTEDKVNKLKELQQAYEASNALDISYLKTIFQADVKSQDTISKVLSVGSVPVGFYWLDKANNQVTMIYADLQGMAGAILLRNQANFDKFQGLKAKVKLAKTQAELDLIVW